MERIGLVGANARVKNAALVARLTLPKSERAERLPALAARVGVSELVYVGTCNRVEIAFRGDGRTEIDTYRRRIFEALLGHPPAPGEAERTLAAWVGEGAVEHLFLVAAGLDSARLGEQEVHEQVRDALELARQAGLSGHVLDHVLTRALAAAAEARRNGPEGDRPASLADIATQAIVDRLRDTPGGLAIVGVSPMTRHCAFQLRGVAERLIVVNRSAEAGESLARELGAAYRSLASFRRQPDGVEAVLVSTGSPGVLLGRPELERLAARAPSHEPPLVVDMCVPPNTDAAAADVTGVPRIGMDEILRRASADRAMRLSEYAPAREHLDASLAKLRRSMAERAISPVIARLHRRYRETALEGVERLFRKELAGLDERGHEVVRRWAEVLARRLAHVPTKGLREVASTFGMPVVKTILDASGEDFFDDVSAEARARLEGMADDDA